MNIVAKKTELQKIANEHSALLAEMEADEQKRTSENTEKLDRLFDAGVALKKFIKQAEEMGEIKAEFEPEGEPKSRQVEGGDGASLNPYTGPQAKSWGRAVIESKQFKEAVAKHGGRSMEPVSVKALYSSEADRGGALIFSQRQTEIVDNARYRERRLLDIINTSNTTSNAIDYIAIIGFTNNAAEVTEWDEDETPDPNFGLKPESDMEFEPRSESVKTIAHWVRESRNLMNDAPRLQNLINTRLLAGLELRLEAQILNGNGAGANLRGILQTSGRQTRQHQNTADRGALAGDTYADTLRRAITDIRLAFYEPNAIVVNPTVGEAMELQKDENKNYMNIYDPVQQRIWRVRVVETPVIAATKAVVGDFNGATLYMREEAEIRVSEHTNDDFIRNAIRVLAELRAALAVTDVIAFEEINLTPPGGGGS